MRESLAHITCRLLVSFYHIEVPDMRGTPKSSVKKVSNRNFNKPSSYWGTPHDASAEPKMLNLGFVAFIV